MSITRDEFDQLAERIAAVERRESRFDELRDLILSLRDDMRDRINGTETRLAAGLAELNRNQITEDDWLRQMSDLRGLINERTKPTRPPRRPN